MSTPLHEVPLLPPLPSAERLLDRVRRRWRFQEGTYGLCAVAAAAGFVVLLLLSLDLAFGLSSSARALLRFLPVLAALGVLATRTLRLLRHPTRERVALLAEERLSLDNRLLTALEPVPEGPLTRAFRADAERRIASADPRRAVPLRLSLPLLLVTGVAVAVAGAVLLAPRGADAMLRRWLHPEALSGSLRIAPAASAFPADVGGKTGRAATTAFGELRWRLEPPAYTGLPPRNEPAGEILSALPGSRIRIAGSVPGRNAEIKAARIGAGELTVHQQDGGWATEWTLATGDRGLVLRAFADGDEVARRIIPIVPGRDRPPEITLDEPAEDLVVAGPQGKIPVRVRARDDYGIAGLELHWIRSRGGGESFAFAEGRHPFAQIRRDRESRGTGEVRVGTGVVDLAELGLEPGDVLHLRAIARDRNDVEGPGEGVSETRIIRVANPDEMELVTTPLGLPPELERNPLLSQRMIILLTERLRDRAPRIGREATLREAQRIAGEQGRLRSRVGEQIFTRSTGGVQDPAALGGLGGDPAGEHGHGEEAGHANDPPAAANPEAVLEAAERATGSGRPEEFVHRHDEAPVIAVDRRLQSAYDAMWEAERTLNQGEPAAALPAEHRALELLQEGREAERVYARGRPPIAPVDVAEARGTGELEDASPAPRSVAPVADDSQRWLGELARVATALRASDGEAATELATLAARLLEDPGVDPRAAALLSRAADAAAAGEAGEAGALLVRARGLLGDAMHAAPSAIPPTPVVHDPAAGEYFRRLGRKP